MANTTTNGLKIDYINQVITMSRAFEKKAANPSSPEYRRLMEVKNSNPNFTIARKEIKPYSTSRRFKNLNYPFMEDYILLYGAVDVREQNYKEYNDLKLRGSVHKQTVTYNVIKKWFLDAYPEIRDFSKDVLTIHDTAFLSTKVNDTLSNVA